MRPLILALSLLASPAHALCQADEIFSCQIGKKSLEVCTWKGMLIYQFGPEGAPEIFLNTPVEDADFTPWPGIGRTMWDEMAFHNEGITYQVWAAIEKQLEEGQPEPVLQGGVNVMKGDEMLANLTCNEGTVRSGLDTIWAMKTDIGQCWNYESQVWQTTPCN